MEEVNVNQEPEMEEKTTKRGRKKSSDEGASIKPNIDSKIKFKGEEILLTEAQSKKVVYYIKTVKPRDAADESPLEFDENLVFINVGDYRAGGTYDKQGQMTDNLYDRLYKSKSKFGQSVVIHLPK